MSALLRGKLVIQEKSLGSPSVITLSNGRRAVKYKKVLATAPGYSRRNSVKPDNCLSLAPALLVSAQVSGALAVLGCDCRAWLWRLSLVA
jgi:hypothetical protein